MAYVEDGLYLWECDAWEAPRPIAVKEGWATGQDINLPADWIDHGTLTPLIAQAQAEPSQVDDALDIPDSPGWWAFNGDEVIVSRRPTEMVVHITKWREVIYDWEYYQFGHDPMPHSFSEADFKETYQGAWYKIAMPWERTTAPNAAATGKGETP